MWREEQSLWDVMSLLYQDKNEKDNSWKECRINFIFFQTDIF